MADKESNLIDVGRIAGVFGVKGWLKVISHTEKEENMLRYSPWWLKTRHGFKAFEVDDHKFRKGGLIVHFKGLDDRDEAAQFNLVNVAVERSQLPELEDGDYYWRQLIGMKVISEYEGGTFLLGQVSTMMETGANDVIVVQPSPDSVDDRERLLPYVLKEFILEVNTDTGCIHVNWDPEF